MEFIRGLHNLKSSHRSCVATIGNFDGIHLGHLALISQLKQKAKALNLPTLIITFEPQPNEYFSNGKITPRLMRLREKLMMFSELKIDRVLCLRFDEALAHLSATDFVKDILIDKLDIHSLIIGDDFRFGYQRQGDFKLLQQLSADGRFTVEKMHTQQMLGDRVSSTQVRLALEHGDLAKADKLLGRPFGMSGRVAHGDKRGRIIGFPTANIFLHRKAVPLSGVYAVKTYEINDKPIYGVANVGTRPTVGGTRSLLEVHLFDFDRDIYGKHIYVEFIHKLRDEKRFDSFELLKRQIMKDAEDARIFFRGM